MKRFQVIYTPIHLATATKTMFVDATSKRKALEIVQRLSRVRTVKSVTQFQ